MKTSRECNESRAFAREYMGKWIEETTRNSLQPEESIIKWNLFTKDNLPQPGRPLLLHFGNDGMEPRVRTGKMKIYPHNRTFIIQDEDNNQLSLRLIISWAYIESLPEEILNNKKITGCDGDLPDSYETTGSNELRKRTVTLYGESCTEKTKSYYNPFRYQGVNGHFC